MIYIKYTHLFKLSSNKEPEALWSQIPIENFILLICIYLNVFSRTSFKMKSVVFMFELEAVNQSKCGTTWLTYLYLYSLGWLNG